MFCPKYILNICLKAGEYPYSEEFLGQESKKREVQEDRTGICCHFLSGIQRMLSETLKS